jgi:hypothetical protein
MTQVKRRYTTNDKSADWIANVDAVNEQTGVVYPFPKEIATYRIGEIEHKFSEYVKIDFDGDQEAALKHLQESIYRRVYSYIERGH